MAPRSLPDWRVGGRSIVAASPGKDLFKPYLWLTKSAEPVSAISGGDALLRWCYRHLISIAGSFYYVSLPVVLVLVLGVTGGIVYAVMWELFPDPGALTAEMTIQAEYLVRGELALRFPALAKS